MEYFGVSGCDLKVMLAVDSLNGDGVRRRERGRET